MLTINALPTKIITEVHSFLDNPKDLATTASVCKLWQTLVDEHCWKQLISTLPEDEVEYTLLPDYKAVCKYWFTVDKKINEMMANEKAILKPPFDTVDGALSIIRNMCGKKRYDQAFIIEDKKSGSGHFTEEHMQGHSFAKGMDAYKRNFIVIQFTDSIWGLSRIYPTVNQHFSNLCWTKYGTIGSMPGGLHLLDANEKFSTTSYHFFKQFLQKGEATHVVKSRDEVHELKLLESPRSVPEYTKPEDF